MPKSSYLQTILNSFTTLDIKSLESHLKRNFTYEDTTADIFLREIGKIFNNAKQSGDTRLIIYEGKCGGTNCPSCGKKGYRFIGDRSLNYLDLIFDGEGDDITDIYTCQHFIAQDATISINYQHEFEIAQDEYVTFNNTPEYLAKVNAAMAAMDELVQTPPRVLIFEELSEWVEKHAPAYHLIGDFDISDPIMKWTPFISIYSDLESITRYIAHYYSEVSRGVLRIDSHTNEEQLLHWLTEHEEAGYGAPWVLKYTFIHKGDYYRWNDKSPIHFTGETFQKTIQFVEYYEQHYPEMFEKYTTRLNEETSFLHNISTDEEIKRLYSLRYHLDKRKALEAEGVITPLYINNNLEDQEGYN